MLNYYELIIRNGERETMFEFLSMKCLATIFNSIKMKETI